jgi:DnaJ-class molecular chaperone
MSYVLCPARVLPGRFFGGFGGGQQEEEVRKGHTIYVDLPVSLRDLYVGREVQVRLARVTRTGRHV